MTEKRKENNRRQLASTGLPSSRGDSIVLWLTMLLFAGPVFLGIALRGARHAYAYLAGDVFYYYAVARNVVNEGCFTYDGIHPTNSFHPLWQLWTVLLRFVSESVALSDAAYPALVQCSSTLFITAALWIFGKTFIRQHGGLPALFPLLPLGLYAILKWWLPPSMTGTLWNLADGMESALVILCYAALFRRMATPGFMDSWRATLGTGCLAALLSLARLDHALFAVALCTCLGAQCVWARDIRRIGRAMAMGAVVAAALGTYAAINAAYAETILPLSGLVKSRFPETLFVDFSLMWRRIAADLGGHAARNNLWRNAQVFLPAFMALLCIAGSALIRRRRPLAPIEFVLLVTACFAILLATYNLFYVPFSEHGTWYFPVSLLFVSLYPLHLAAPLLTSATLGKRLYAGLATASAILVLPVASLYWVHNPNAIFHTFLDRDAAPMRAHYKGQDIKLLEYDDGFMAYATGLPTLSGSLLMADKAAVSHVLRERKSILDLATKRGHDRIATLSYGWPYCLLSPQAPPSEAGFHVVREKKLLRHTDLYKSFGFAPYIFRVDYANPARNFAVLHFTPMNPDYLEARDLQAEERWNEALERFEGIEDSSAIPRDTFFKELAETALNAGEMEKAEAAFGRLREENEAILAHYPAPEAFQSEYLSFITANIAWAEMRLGNTDKALEYSDKAVALFPANEALIYMPPPVFGETTEHPRGLGQVYEKAMALGADDPQIALRWGAVMADAGNLETAVKAYRAALSLRPSLAGRVATELEERAAAYDEAGEDETALAHYGAALEFQPDNAGLALRYARTALAAGQNELAMRLFEKTVAIQAGMAPAIADALREKAKEHMAEEAGFEKGMALAEKALDLNPQLAQPIGLLVLDTVTPLFEAGHWQQGIDRLRLAVRLHDTLQIPAAESARQAAEEAMKLGELDEALHRYRAAIEFSPDTAPYYIRAGEIEDMKGDVDDALATYRKGIDADPEYDGAYHAYEKNLANRQQHQFRVDKWKEVIQAYPDSPTAHAYFGLAYISTGAFEEAQATLRRAAELAPDDRDMQRTAGQRLFRAQDYEGAIACLERALKLSSAHEGAINVLIARAYYRIGEYDKAWPPLTRAKELGARVPSHVEVDLKRHQDQKAQPPEPVRNVNAPPGAPPQTDEAP